MLLLNDKNRVRRASNGTIVKCVEFKSSVLETLILPYQMYTKMLRTANVSCLPLVIINSICIRALLKVL
jgi:hypothetical protein